MKKLTTSILFSILFVAGFTSTSNAQGSQLGFNLRTGVPVGEFSEYAGFGLGGGIEYNYLFSDNFGIGLDFGYMTFMENDLADFVTGSSVIVPIGVNARYTFGETNFRPFVGVGLGYSIVQQTTTLRIPRNNPQNEELYEVNEFDEQYSGITVTPHIGFSVPMDENTSIYLKADYTYILNEAEVTINETGSNNGGPTGDGSVTTIAVDPYAYVGINLGMIHTFGE